MHEKLIVATIGALAAMLPASAAAQADRTDRSDTSEFRARARAPQPAPRSPQAQFLEMGAVETPPKASLTFSIGSPFLFDGNPESDPNGSRSAAYSNPSASLALKVPSALGKWDLKVAAASDADLLSRDPDDLDETRITGQVSFSRALTAGRLTLGFKEKVAYAGAGYSRFSNAVERYFVSFAPTVSDKVAVTVTAEYRASSALGQRRVFGSADVQWTALDTDRLSLVFDQEFDLSAFRKGPNTGRVDVLSQSSVALTPKIGLPDNVSLSFNAFFFHRFSNRSTSRFSDFQIGPTLSVDFK